MHDIGVFSRIIQDVEAVYLSIDSSRRFKDILNFLHNVAESGYDSSTTEILHRPDSVTVSTIHKIKGLEFPVVFVVDVETQRFPARTLRYDGWLPQLVIETALRRGAYQKTPTEEARLFYTAVTRAHRFLYVSGSVNLPGGQSTRQKSPYALRLAHPEISNDTNGLPAGLEPHARVRRIDETVVPTTFSEIRFYLRCPRDYLYRKLYGFSPPIREMFGYGQTVHATIGRLHQSFREGAPTVQDAERLADDTFHLKHVASSRDPANRPGPYERAHDSAVGIVRDYVNTYGDDFHHKRQVEVRFEIPVQHAVITGTIDLLIRYDAEGNVVEASVIDFKTLRGGDEPETNDDDLDWTELAMQVQLYAHAANEILGENARTGAVHLLRDNQRVTVPIEEAAVQAAIQNVEWAVRRILDGEFPMRPSAAKCSHCDFRALCPRRPENFRSPETPPPVHIPGPDGTRLTEAFSDFDPEYHE